MKRIFIFLSIFIIHNVYADPIDQDVLGGCDNTVLNTVDNIANLIPAFSLTVYTCSAGQFLPADTTGCRTCPSGYNCAGGDMTFNENDLSGIDYRAPIQNSTQYTCSKNFLHTNSNNIANLIPIFEISVYNCAPGYYVPADTEGCVKCSVNYYCPGGTYTFNETVPQGIEPCPEGTFAPMGSSMCYEHILHIGDDVVYLKSTKLTTPSLNVGMDDGVFYANMTTTPTPMNVATERYLKIEYDGVVYYVCDDTTYNSD